MRKLFISVTFANCRRFSRNEARFSHFEFSFDTEDEKRVSVQTWLSKYFAISLRRLFHHFALSGSCHMCIISNSDLYFCKYLYSVVREAYNLVTSFIVQNNIKLDVPIWTKNILRQVNTMLTVVTPRKTVENSSDCWATYVAILNFSPALPGNKIFAGLWRKKCK